MRIDRLLWLRSAFLTSLPSLHLASAPAPAPAPALAPDPLRGDARALNAALAHVQTLQSGVASGAALAALALELLAERERAYAYAAAVSVSAAAAAAGADAPACPPPLPIGELGKLLQCALGRARVTELVRGLCGGLKRLLELHPALFAVSQGDSTTPGVGLRGGVRGQLLERAEALAAEAEARSDAWAGV